MTGKPYAGQLHVRFDEGKQDNVLRTVPNGHEVGNDRYSQEFDLTNDAPVLYSTSASA